MNSFGRGNISQIPLDTYQQNKKKIFFSNPAHGLQTPVKFNQQEFSTKLLKNLDSVLNFTVKRFACIVSVGLCWKI